MSFVLCKRVYLRLLETSRLNLRYKQSTVEKLMDVMTQMQQNKNTLTNANHTSLSFVEIKVIGNSSIISPCGVSLNTPNRYYLFNCGEGTQRVLSEYKIKPSKYRDIFFTYPSWKNIGGFIGTALTMQESNVSSFKVHGHKCLGKYFNLMRTFVNFKGIRENMKHCNHNTEYSDEFINVKYIHLHRSPSVNLNKNVKESSVHESHEVANLNTEEGKYSNNEEEINNFLDNDNKEKILSLSKMNYVISFIVRTEKSAGSLSFEKCVDLGVPVGPLLGKLKNGEDVQLENGNIVKSSDVKSPDLPGVIIIIVECPSEDYLDALLNEPAFFKHESDKHECYTCVVVHFSSSTIVKNEKYQKWINSFSKDTKHVFVNEASEICGAVGLHRHQHKLNLVHSEIFPKIHDFGIPEYPRIQNTILEEGHVVADVPDFVHEKNSLQIHSDKVYYQCVDNMHINGETLCEIVLKPKRTYDYSKCLVLKKEEYLKEVFEVPNLQSKLEKYKKKIESIEETLQSDRRIYPKIVFLGTGSKKPSKTRNSSGILVFLNEDKSIILDCGEGFYCQLLLFYGKEKAKEILRSLRAVFISHMHVDHHLGLTALLLKRKVAFDELNMANSGSESSKPFKPLRIIAPVQIMPFLHYLSTEIIDLSGLYELFPCKELLSYNTELTEVLNDLDLENLQTADMLHTANSFGVSFTHLDGWKLTYSGDTRPCKNLIEIGKDSDILIHEATFDDIFVKEAKEKLHTTTGQAISVGRQMNAKFILLTHFSQRYCHLPMINNDLLSKLDVGVAFDFMQVSPYQLPVLPHLYEPLQLVFSSYQEKLEQRDAMLKLKRNREEKEYTSEIKTVPIKVSKTL